MGEGLTRFLVGALLFSPVKALADATSSLCSGAGGSIKGSSCDTPGKSLAGKSGYVSGITNTLITIAGAIAVIVIIIGGIRYITSTGDATRVKQAKDTILYGVIGLIVVIMAYAIVNFVIGHLT